MSLEDIVVGEVEELEELPEKLKKKPKKVLLYDILFDTIDSKLQNTGDVVSFSIKDPFKPQGAKIAITRRLRLKERKGEWKTYWDKEENKVFVQKIK